MHFAFLVPAPDYPDPWDWAFDVQADALRKRGVGVDAVRWTSGEDLSGYDLVLPLVVWGYHLRYAEWLQFLDSIEAAGLPIVNPPALLRWNSDKAYLSELSNKGVAAIPTLGADSLGEEDLARAADLFGTGELVVKPPVSASASGTHRVRVGDPIPPDERGQRMLIQPFLPAIASEGEYGIMLFDGQYSHAVVKRPKSGDFRVQPSLGGSSQSGEAPSEAIELARSALSAAPTRTTYARVDVLRAPDGAFHVMEMELIEPALFLDGNARAEERFVNAVLAAAELAKARSPLV